jgi:hypothetical protein
MRRKTEAFFGAVLLVTSIAPVAEADPPPPPWTGQPTSTSGTALMPPEAPAEPGAPPPTADPALAARVAALEARLAEEKKNQELSDEDRDALSWLRRFKLSGFVQPELEWNWYNAAASPNAQANGLLPPNVGANDVTALPTGGTTNTAAFRIRRARLRAEFMPADAAQLVFEIDPTPPDPGVGATTTTTILRTVEAQGTARFSRLVETEFAVGLFKVPFGFEVQENDADRPFIERSWGARNMFPGEFDTGARAYTYGGRLTVELAILNGQTIGEKTFTLQPDLNKGKDLVGRVNYCFGWLDVGASGYYGQGQVVDAAALAFKQFARYAVDVEARLHRAFFPLGESRAFVELVRGENMDRGVYYGALSQPAIPADVFNGAVNGLDELSYWIRVEQDITRWFTAGLRYDYYTPNSAQGTNGRDTFGAVAAWNVVNGLKLMAEYDHAVDNVHAPGAAAPSREIDTASGVLQARF